MTQRDIGRIRICLAFAVIAILYGVFLIFPAMGLISDINLKFALRVVALALSVFVVAILDRNAAALLLPLATTLYFLWSGNQFLLNFTALLILGLLYRNIELTSFARILFNVVVAGIVLHALVLFLSEGSFDLVSVQGRERYYLAFSNPNTLAVTYFSAIAASLILLQYEKNTYLKLASCIVIIISLIVIYTSDSRTFIISTVILLMSSALLKALKPNRMFNFAVCFMPFILLSISLYTAVKVNDRLDQILSYRLLYAERYILSASGWDFLTGWASNTAHDVHNAYLLLLGAIGLPLTMAALGWMSWRLYTADFRALPFLCTTLIISAFESTPMRPEVPISMIFVYFLARGLGETKGQMSLNDRSIGSHQPSCF